MPDRLDLHCILLDKFAFNVENGTYGYDRSIISVKDLVWVYDLMPVVAALASPEAGLARARIPKTAALDTNSTFFFRVARFAFVMPPIWTESRYGMVLSVTRRGQYVNNFRMTIEGTRKPLLSRVRFVASSGPTSQNLKFFELFAVVIVPGLSASRSRRRPGWRTMR
ncbi:hypothetical protein GCK32_007726 [Trichostrongylus colubriformis]|uniref:Uncharacterized protein n=1 Tax=Trichostrongylus colubriformis TaxID=6319 RepID=A0AAN8FM90_TRICO